MAKRNLGTIVGALIGTWLSFMVAKTYEIPLMYTIGPAYYPVALATGAVTGGLAGKCLYNPKTKSD